MSGRSIVGALSFFLLSCAGGSPRLVQRAQTEAAGAHCPEGGVAVETGFDANFNQVLDDAEVKPEETRYVCNGARGTSQSSRTTVTAEPAGTHCPSGGVRIDVGVDADADGTLSAAEITGTQYVCNGGSSASVYFGDVTLRTAADLAQLDGIETLAGDLFVVSGPGGVVSLPALRVVAGRIHIFASEGDPFQGTFPALTSLQLPELVRAGVIDAVFTDALATFSAPKLERVKSFTFTSNPELTTVTLSKLAVVDDALAVRTNDRLPALALPELQIAQSVQITGNPLLASVSGPRLAEVRNTLEVFGNPLLSACAGYSMYANLTVLPRFSALDGNDDTVVCTGAQICSTRTVTGVSNPLAWCVRPLSFSAAQATCASLGTGAALAWVTSDAEWIAFSAAVSTGAFPGAGWLGYTDAATEGTWVAVGGFSGYSPTSRSDFWAPGNPSGSTSSNAVELGQDGLARDTDATRLSPFTCRVP